MTNAAKIIGGIALVGLMVWSWPWVKENVIHLHDPARAYNQIVGVEDARAVIAGQRFVLLSSLPAEELTVSDVLYRAGARIGWREGHARIHFAIPGNHGDLEPLPRNQWMRTSKKLGGEVYRYSRDEIIAIKSPFGECRIYTANATAFEKNFGPIYFHGPKSP